MLLRSLSAAGAGTAGMDNPPSSPYHPSIMARGGPACRDPMTAPLACRMAREEKPAA